MHEQQCSDKAAALLQRSVLNEQCLYQPLVRHSDNGFTSLEEARAWVRDFICWYNNEHRHSRIRFVTPAERHRGQDHYVLARRDALYQQARAERPERWSGNTRNWQLVGTVTLNPEKQEATQNKAA